MFLGIIVIELGMVIVDKLVQYSKTPYPRVVNVDGSNIEVKPEQPEKAPLLIVVTVEGITIDINEVHFQMHILQ